MAHSAEARAKMSVAKMGHEVSAETRAKIAASVSRSQQGHVVSSETARRIAAAQAGEQGHNWRGDDVGYGGAHKRHRAALPAQCAHCGTTDGRLDAALRHDAPEQNLRWCEKRGRWYSPRTEDYTRLCRSCHNRYDGKVPPRRDALARA